MPVTLRSLLAHSEFRLNPVTGLDSPGVLDEPIAWVHNSDLADPTPWLEAGQLLLTDGLQFDMSTTRQWAADYVRRLRGRGLLGLGFATQVAHDAIPRQLVEACTEQGFPLIEVADRMPFIAIIRHVADVISSEQRERLEWSTAAQRAVARAALRPDGLEAVLRELERQLGCWVALYDAGGNRVEIDTAVAIPEALRRDVDDAVIAALQRGAPSGGRLQLGEAGATLQTLGRRGKLRGILAVGTGGPLDAAESDLVSSVIGLASIALEQSRALETARLRVRAGVLEMLLSGSTGVADKTARQLWGKLPSAPIRVAVVAGDTAAQSLLSELELTADRHRGRIFFAERDTEIIVLTQEADIASVTAVLRRQGRRAGFSAPVAWGDLRRGLPEGRIAAGRTTSSHPFVFFEKLVDEGIVAFLDAAGVAPVARRRLEPVLTSSNPHHQNLLKTLEVWLEHNAAWDPAARELNIHPHTLRNRLHMLEKLLDANLDKFSDRAELWSALQFVDYPGKQDARSELGLP